MLFHDSKDESAWGLAIVGVLIVSMAAILGEITGNVQPKAPVEISHPEVASPMEHERVEPGNRNPESSPYPQPQTHKK